MDRLEGGCACGAVRYHLAGRPMFVNCCHCRDCQRQSGTAFALNAMIETDRVVMSQGTLTCVAMPTDSGRPHLVDRCASCGTAVWSDYGGRKVMRFLRVGTLDDPAALAPGAHIFIRSKQPWVVLAPEVPAFEVYYQMAELWPAESLRRREALLGPGR